MERRENNIQTRISTMDRRIVDAASQQSASIAVYSQDDLINLKELFWLIIDKWKAILLAMLLGAVLFGLYHTFLMKPTYEADASIFITSNESVISVADLQISSELTQDYSNIIKSRNVLKQVIKDLDLNLDYKQLSKLVTVSNPQDSHIIQISVQCGDVELCRDIANSLMNIGIDRIYQVIGSSEPTVIPRLRQWKRYLPVCQKMWQWAPYWELFLHVD